ncbi:MAG: hypothetical protein JWQ21_3043 [Herminiimonas sp.]|nr:hypothetical protein [Herminiimonas sp.]
MKAIIIGIGLMFLAALSQSSAYAQSRPLKNGNAPSPTDPKNRNSSKKPPVVCGLDNDKPDLTIASAEVTKADQFIIVIKNIGPCIAPQSQLAIYIAKTEEGTKDASAFSRGDYIPELKSGQSFTYKTIFSGISKGAWGLVYEDKYVFRLVIDFANKIQEENEYNNEFYVKQ